MQWPRSYHKLFPFICLRTSDDMMLTLISFTIKRCAQKKKKSGMHWEMAKILVRKVLDCVTWYMADWRKEPSERSGHFGWHFQNGIYCLLPPYSPSYTLYCSIIQCVHVQGIWKIPSCFCSWCLGFWELWTLSWLLHYIQAVGGLCILTAKTLPQAYHVAIKDWSPKLEAVIYMETVLITWSPKLEAKDLRWESWDINTVTVSVTHKEIYLTSPHDLACVIGGWVRGSTGCFTFHHSPGWRETRDVWQRAAWRTGVGNGTGHG